MNHQPVARPQPPSERVSGTSPVVQGESGHWGELFQGGRRLEVRRGYVILQPGQPCDYLYYLESGRVSVTLNWHDGTEKVIGVVLPGTIFAETFFFRFRAEVLSATIKADRDSVIYALGWEAVEKALRTDPDLALSLIRTLARKMGMLIKQIEDLRFRSVEARVASLLYVLAAGDERGGDVVLRLTHSAVADLVGAHRVSVNNAMLDLQDRGFIELKSRRVIIKDLAALYALGYPSSMPGEGSGAFAALD